MTVIATDGKTMAGDSYSTSHAQILREARKVHRLKDGRIVGACGPTTDCIELVRWLDDGGEKPSLGEDVQALILNPDGKVDWIDCKFVLVKDNLVPYAIGSGGDLALGAMLAGASPREAAKVACLRQRDCGGDITVMRRK